MSNISTNHDAVAQLTFSDWIKQMLAHFLRTEPSNNAGEGRIFGRGQHYTHGAPDNFDD